MYEERGRIAQELHDHIAQILFFLNVTLKQGQLEEARIAVSEIDNHLRQAIFNLRSLPEEGITLTLQPWQCRCSGIASSFAKLTLAQKKGIAWRKFYTARRNKRSRKTIPDEGLVFFVTIHS